MTVSRTTFLKVALASALCLLPLTACDEQQSQNTSGNSPAAQAADPQLDGVEQTLQQLEADLNKADTLDDAVDELK